MVEYIEYIFCTDAFFVAVFASRIDREHTGNRLRSSGTAGVHLGKIDDMLTGEFGVGIAFVAVE